MAAKLRAPHLLSAGTMNYNVIRHGNLLLTDTIHQKLFVINKSKGDKFMPKMLLIICVMLSDVKLQYLT